MELKPPVNELFKLADRVSNRIVTYRFAVAHIAGQDWNALTEDDVSTALQLIEVDSVGEPERASVLAHLTVLAAAARWGEDRGSPWWEAADLYVDVVRRQLGHVADGGRLHEAIEVVTRQIAVLDERLADLRGRRFRRRHQSLIDSEEQELADTLQGAAALVVGPYLENYYLAKRSGSEQAVWESLNSWLNPAGSGRVQRTSDEQHRHVPMATFCEDLDKEPMSTPLHATETALAYLDTALTTAQGHIRGMCLFKKVESLDFLSFVRGDGKEFEFEDLQMETAREALAHLDGKRAPGDRIVLIDWLVRHGAMAKPHHLSDLLTSPLDEIKHTQGPDETLRILLVVGLYTSAPDILAELQVSAGEILEDVRERHLVLDYYDILVHRLPENVYRCPGVHHKFDLDRENEPLPHLGKIRRESPVSAAATLLHIVSHMRDADTRMAVKLLEEVAHLDPVFAEDHKWLMIHLAVSAWHRYADLLAKSGKLLEAFSAYTKMAEDLVRLVANQRLPSMLLQTFAHEALGRSLSEDSLSGSELLVGALLLVISPVVNFLTPSRTPEHENFVQALGILVYQRIHMSTSVELSFVHHCIFKGVDVGILLDNAQRRNIGLYSSRLLEEIRAREAALGPYVPPRIDSIEETSEAMPSGISALCYVALGESTLNSCEDGSIESLRKAFDRSVTSDLLTGLLTSAPPGLATRDPLSEFERIRRLLPQDTVLISLFVGELSGTATPDEPANYSGLTLFAATAEDCQAYLLRLHVLGGVLGLGNGDQLVRLHRLAFDVAELRLCLTAGSPNRSVSPHAKELLEGFYGRFGGPPAEALARWRAEGKTHLCIWPHGPLHYVPFHLLHHDGRPLADDWTVTTIPTPAVFGRAPSVPKELQIVFAGTRTSHPAFELPVQAAVSKHVQDLATRVQPSQLLVDAQVTPLSLLAAAEHATHLHIAAHGSHDAEAAWFQCLYLNPDPGNDGRLFAFQIAQADLRAVELVTLSACESAMGRYDLNDNLRGLPAAFLLAGASSVIGALWPVTAGVASRFFEQLYLCLSTGDGKRAAFRTAQLVTRQRYPAYKDWGAFTYIGSWD
ncbi:CHAT domain-containing protein [Streptomyces sp. R21]|uniref:CHAT domain-containing protein n=1 Tax=Streptomyces sp. R21 TaxID=3238627 RepID=A0AB39NXZ1_9ACTN